MSKINWPTADELNKHWKNDRQSLTDDHTETYKKAVEKFGEVHQMIKSFEEISELNLAIARIMNDFTTDKITDQHFDNLCEEIADVEIMIEQLKIIFDCHAIIETVKKQKIERLKGLIDD